ncbi:ABC transporter permease [Natronoglycomyces albus]|uniref:Transport permease protein n=1 Tax=Natronoglycomyces albus TaxID=2811108 RepID=A0A895XSL4_9ACTN|nr:ABC transporter permease [Natronoglycomyces albus]QSB05536.1 ABC transporter permease [Natronoglycomyces albus]
MNLRHTLVCAARVLRQIKSDRRTIGMMLAVPALLMTLMYFIFESSPEVFNRVGLIMLGVFPFVLMFLVTSVTMLRERTGGTLERLMTTPCGKFDLIAGYAIAFGLAAAAQSSIAAAVAYWFLGLETVGSVGLVVLIAVVTALLGMALGLLVSAFARSEFQAVQFMPVVVVPQLLLCGLIWPREEMAGWLQAVSDLLPLTYAIEALGEVQVNAEATGTLWFSLGIVGGAAIVAVIAGALTLRRRTA